MSAATCDGSGECKADQHLHGCYSDDGTNCDHPSEHERPAAKQQESRCHLRRFGFLWRLHRWEEAGWGCERCKDCGAMR